MILLSFFLSLASFAEIQTCQSEVNMTKWIDYRSYDADQIHLLRLEDETNPNYENLQIIIMKNYAQPDCYLITKRIGKDSMCGLDFNSINWRFDARYGHLLRFKHKMFGQNGCEGNNRMELVIDMRKPPGKKVRNKNW